MNKFFKIAAVAAAALATTPALAAPVGVDPNNLPEARARIVKPLTLTAAGTLNFGTIVIDPLFSGSSTVSVAASTTAGITCATNLICDASGGALTYTINGTRGQEVQINLDSPVLDGPNGATLPVTLSTNVPANGAGEYVVTLPNSSNGVPAGLDFYVGGSIDIADTTVDGLYEGEVNVTVEYN